jgi:hypothetical protein
MHRRLQLFIVLAGMVVSLCVVAQTPETAPTEETAPATEAAAEEQAATEESPATDSTVVEPPFSADQIRAEWVRGLVVDVERKTPAGAGRERWTVRSATADGCEIEYATLDANGNVTGRPRVEKNTWVELQDHAAFPADSTQSSEIVRGTPLGILDGWLFTVSDEAAGTVTEYFFARAYPGAPVHMITLRGGNVVLELTQLERRQP